jgi:hypothetical protein
MDRIKQEAEQATLTECEVVRVLAWFHRSAGSDESLIPCSTCRESGLFVNPMFAIWC